MAAKSYFRGWPIVWIGNKGDKETRIKAIHSCDIDRMSEEERTCLDGHWIYEDTGERLPATGGEIRPCKKCGKLFPLGEGDPCLGVLPGVNSACCGHGVSKASYIRFINGMVIQGFTDKGKGLPPKKLAEMPEFDQAIHILQGIMAKRILRRDYPAG
jgi:hypothetical protein